MNHKEESALIVSKIKTYDPPLKCRIRHLYVMLIIINVISICNLLNNAEKNPFPDIRFFSYILN